jgi:ankyrin repeat protein
MSDKEKFKKIFDEIFKKIFVTVVKNQVSELQKLLEGIKSRNDDIEIKPIVNIKYDEGMTPLMIAVEEKNIEMVAYLLSQDADINAQNDKRMTPLMIAVEKENIEMVTYLLSQHAKIDLKNNDGQTAMDIAKDNNSKNIVDILTNWKRNGGKNTKSIRKKRKPLTRKIKRKPLTRKIKNPRNKKTRNKKLFM